MGQLSPVQRRILDSALYDADIEPDNVRWDYSGRGMYGRPCLAITESDYSSQSLTGLLVRIGFALGQVAADQDRPDDEQDAATELVEALSMPSTDSLGRGAIIYWPGIQGSEDDAS